MLRESNVAANGVDPSGAYVECAQLCDDCPRRTGEVPVRANGIKGWLGKRVMKSVHGDPLKSGVIKSYQTNGRHGLFYGERTDNSGTVAGLNGETAQQFVEAVIGCDGPTERGSVCSALGKRSFEAIVDLDRSMEDALDRQPVDAILASIASDSTKVPADQMAETIVFINTSEPAN